jgi:AraC-like DNA-binding protein
MAEALLHPSYLRWLERLLRRRGDASGPIALAPPQSPAELERVAERALRLSRDPNLGLLLGAAIPVLAHGPLAALLAAAPTLGRAFEALARYAPLRAPGLCFEWRSRGETGELATIAPSGTPRAERILCQALAVLLERLCEQLLGEAPVGLLHRFPWPEEDPAAYRRHLRGKSSFAAPHYALRVPRNLLAMRLPGADQEAYRTARRALEAMRARMGEGIAERPATAAVERLLWQAEGRWPDLSATALALATSVRSLQRALAREGTGFRALCERVRAERARELIVEGRLPVAAIAERLGYRDPGNFARSLRRWTGTTARRLRAAKTPRKTQTGHA